MKTVQGDLIELAVSGEFDVIVHGCNCQCAMGAGIARAIKSAFPAAFEADCSTEKGDRSKLGSISYAKVQCGGNVIIVVNAYTQFHWRGRGPKVDYEALRLAFREVKKQFFGLRIAYPLIGAGLAGGDWNKISCIIDAELEGEEHTLVTLPDKS